MSPQGEGRVLKWEGWGPGRGKDKILKVRVVISSQEEEQRSQQQEGGSPGSRKVEELEGRGVVPEWGGAESGTLEESGSSPREGVGAHFVLWAILASPLLSALGAPWRGVNLGPRLPSSRHKDRGPQFPQRQKLGLLQQRTS